MVWERIKNFIDKKEFYKENNLIYKRGIMLYGEPPPTHKAAPKVMKDIFYTKEKMLELKYIKTLEKAVKNF